MANESSPQALTLTDDNFNEQVLQNKKPVLVDFWAPWCRPCQALVPVIDALAQTAADKFVIGKLDVDQNAQTSRTYGVQSIPTLIIFKNGQEVDRMRGLQTKAALEEKLAAHVD